MLVDELIDQRASLLAEIDALTESLKPITHTRSALRKQLKTLNKSLLDICTVEGTDHLTSSSGRTVSVVSTKVDRLPATRVFVKRASNADAALREKLESQLVNQTETKVSTRLE